MKTAQLAAVFLLAGGMAAGGAQEAQAQMPISNPMNPANPLNPIYHTSPQEDAAQREARQQRQAERRAALEERKQALFDGIGDFNTSAEDLRPLAQGLRNPSANDLRFLEDCRLHVAGNGSGGQLDAETTQMIIDCMTGKAADARKEQLRQAAPVLIAVGLLVGGLFGGGYIAARQMERRRSGDAPKR